ncbi:putative major facilitator superfamily, MFS transporter superfamily [Helianthus anomalus]
MGINLHFSNASFICFLLLQRQYFFHNHDTEDHVVSTSQDNTKLGLESFRRMRTAKFPTRYLIVILTFVCTSVCYIERVGFSIAYTIAADATDVSQSSKGTILSVFYYGYAFSQVPGGWAAQKIGGRRILLFSFVIWSLTCALCPLDPNRVTALVIARLLWVPPHERSRSLSLTTSGMYLGAALGMLILPSLVKFNGPQSVFIAEAALGIT